MVAQAGGRPLAAGALERRQPAARHRARLLELVRGGVLARGQRRVDERRRDSARPELGAQPGRAVAPGRARGDPLLGERRVVEIAAGGEIGDDLAGNRRRRAAPAQTSVEVTRGPGVARQEVGGREPRGPRVEDSARTARARYDRLKKELPVGDTGARSVVRCSNDCSPVEKMPRTLRSKSSALVAASRAVSYEMTPSR
jgi:hypothetical protein